MLRNPIPKIIDPLGKYWDQPNANNFIFDPSGVVIMSEEDFKQLHDYSHSLPTGQYEGKMWKSKSLRKGEKRPELGLRWYDHHPDPKKISIGYMEIVVI